MDAAVGAVDAAAGAVSAAGSASNWLSNWRTGGLMTHVTPNRLSFKTLQIQRNIAAHYEIGKMLGVIPPEVILTILSFLPFRQLHRLRLVSKSWNKFIYLNESSIYHAAAILHDFVPANTCILDPRLHDVSGISLVNSWKDLCVWSII